MKAYSNVRSDEKGAALIEFALSMFILIPLAVGSFEIGRALIGYQELMLSAKEVTKVAVRTVGGSAVVGTCVSSFPAVASGASCAGHEDIHARAGRLLAHSPWVSSFTQGNYQITTTRAADNSYTVEITVTPNYGLLSYSVETIRVAERGVLI